MRQAQPHISHRLGLLFWALAQAPSAPAQTPPFLPNICACAAAVRLAASAPFKVKLPFLCPTPRPAAKLHHLGTNSGSPRPTESPDVTWVLLCRRHVRSDIIAHSEYMYCWSEHYFICPPPPFSAFQLPIQSSLQNTLRVLLSPTNPL